MKPSDLRWLLAALAAAGASAAQASPEFQFSGFGTLGAAHSSKAGIEFVQPGQPSGAGTDSSIKPDTRIAGQLDARFGGGASATMQVMSKYTGDGNWKPAVEWLFGKLHLGEAVSVRVGRMGAPFFAVSDFREVGYASVWLRAPVDVYGQVFLRSFDGVDVQYSGKIADVPVTAQLLAGGTTAPFEGASVDFKRQIGINVTAEVADGVTLRAGTIQGRLTATNSGITQLVAGLKATPFAELGQTIECASKRAGFSGLGLNVDRGDWVAAAEVTHRNSDCIVSTTTGWLAMLGRRFGSVTPYAIVSGVSTGAGAVENTIPAGVAPQLDVLRNAIEGAKASLVLKQRSTALGLRWDAARNLAVKAQVDRIDLQGGRGLFVQTGPLPAGTVTVTSVAVDFVF